MAFVTMSESKVYRWCVTCKQTKSVDDYHAGDFCCVACKPKSEAYANCNGIHEVVLAIMGGRGCVFSVCAIG